MSIMLSEACKASSKEVKVIRDCQFDVLYLVGKPYPEGKKTVAFLGGEKFIDNFLDYNIDGVICTESIAEKIKDDYKGGIVVSPDPKYVFFEMHNYLSDKTKNDNCVKIAETATIHPSVIIENDVKIGNNTIIMANVVIKDGTEIGDDCIIREGCVLGTPAFYYFGNGNEKTLVTSNGRLIIGNNVELHANVVVEKGVLGGKTVIGNNVKIDNLCLIGHDSKLGDSVMIAAGSTLAGNVTLKDGAFLGVGAVVSPSVTCGENVLLSSGAVATKDIEKDIHASGNFAISHDKYLKHIKDISK